MPILGDLIRYSIANKRRKKAIEEFLKQFPEEKQPFAGKKVSELAAVLGGVGESMPIPEHMGGNALPFSQTPTLRQDQMRQMTPPSLINPQNAQLAKAKALMRSGLPEGEEMGLNMLAPQQGKVPPPVPSAGGAWLLNPETGSYEFQRTESQKTEVHEYVPGRTYEVTRPGGKTERITIPGEKDYEWKDILDPEATAKAGFEVAYLHRHLKGSDEPWENTGMMTQYNKPGAGVTVNTGDMGKPTPAMRTDLQKNISKANVTMDRLESVRSQWKPDWSYIETQAWQFAKGAIDKSKLLSSTVGKAIPEESWKDFGAYKAWDRDMQSTINTHIHDMTGAQMSQAEIKRLLLEMATKSDGPVAYKAKIDATITMLGSAKKEWERMLNTSVASGEMPIEEAQTALDEIIVANLKMIAGEGESDQPDWVEPVE
jgi:hypothetical protein